MKQCSICEKKKHESEFYKGRWCKPCTREKVKQYRERNSDICKQRQKKYREANKEKIAESKKKCWFNKIEQYQKHSKIYRQAHKAQKAETDRKYREKNKDILDAKRKTNEHRAKNRKWCKDRYNKNEAFRRNHIIKGRKRVLDYADDYMKRLLMDSGYKEEEITPSFIKLKKALLIFKRKKWNRQTKLIETLTD